MENATLAAPGTNETPTDGDTSEKPVETQAPETTPVDAAEGKKEGNGNGGAEKFKVKVDGKEVELTRDEILRHASLGMGAGKRFEEAARIRKEAERVKAETERFFRMLKEDPISTLMDPRIGHDFKQLAQDYLLKEIERERMTPEQRELHEARERLKALEEEKRTLSERQEQEKMEGLVKHFSDQYEKDVTEALQTSGLPKTTYTVKRMAYYMNKALEKGVELRAADTVELVREDYLRDFNAFFSMTDGDALASILGDENLKKIREFELKRVAGGTASSAPSAQSGGAASGKPAQRSRKMTPEEWKAELDKKFPAPKD